MVVSGNHRSWPFAKPDLRIVHSGIANWLSSLKNQNTYGKTVIYKEMEVLERVNEYPDLFLKKLSM